jgi:hypothetical protein
VFGSDPVLTPVCGEGGNQSLRSTPSLSASAEDHDAALVARRKVVQGTTGVRDTAAHEAVQQ